MNIDPTSRKGIQNLHQVTAEPTKATKPLGIKLPISTTKADLSQKQAKVFHGNNKTNLVVKRVLSSGAQALKLVSSTPPKGSKSDEITALFKKETKKPIEAPKIKKGSKQTAKEHPKFLGVVAKALQAR